MINGAHVVVFTKDPRADRAFFRDVLGFANVDVGGGWLIFALPPAEAAFHPADSNDTHELYLMCDDVEAEMARLSAAGAACEPVTEMSWGRLTRMTLPGGGKVALYQPKHARAHGA